MGSADRLFNRQRSVREILGGGLVADVILWRRKNLTRRLLLVALAAWVVFERSGYTLVSLVSSVLLLLITLLFLWARSAAILNSFVRHLRITVLIIFVVYVRMATSLKGPAPPRPEMQISAEMMEGIASLVRTHANSVLSAFRNITLDKDSGLYLKVAASLFLLSVLGGLTDFLTLGYTSLIVVFTIPAMYDKYEEHVDGYTAKGYHNLGQFYAKLYGWCSSKVQQWIAEAKKLN